MQKRLIRILSVFMAVVIICCTCLQPVAYANTAVAGGVVLFIAAMLTASGLTFSSAQQAQSAASSAIGSMPPDLFAAIQDALLRSTVVGVGKFYEMMEKGIDSVVPVSKELWTEFRAWVDAHFGIDAWTVEAGCISYFTGSDSYAVPSSLPLDYINNPSYVNNYPYVIVYYRSSGDFQFRAHKYRPYAFYENDFVLVQPDRLGQIRANTPVESVLWNPSVKEASSTTIYQSQIIHYANFDILFEDSTIYRSTSSNSVDYSIGLSSDAYNYTIPGDPLVISIAIPVTAEMLTSKNFLDILNDYALDNWDFKESLDKMREQIEANIDVLNTMGLESVQNNVISLLLEIDALRSAIAAEGIDVIGGVGALNGVMVDAGIVITNLEAILAQGQAAADTVIIDLTLELERVKEEIARLLQERETDEPDDPSIPESKSKIKWEILLNLAIFKKFPFSLPKDVYAFVTALAAPPKEPVFEFDLFGSISGGLLGDAGKITIDFKRFEKIRLLFRNGFLIAFIVGLMTATKKYIWTGGG